MKNATFTIVLTAACGLGFTGGAAAETSAIPGSADVPPAGSTKPNVLFIVVDDLRPELGCYGPSQIKSPNIDQLAATGLRFSRAYCQQAVCGPSRASFLTGLRPDSTGVHTSEMYFRKKAPDVVTLPQYFKQNGYQTESLGKIFHGAHAYPKFGDPVSWSVPPQYPKSPVFQWYDPKNVALVKRKQEALRKQGKSEIAVIMGARGPAYESADVPDSAYHDGELADMAIESLKRLKTSGTPFFLAVGFVRPHLPFCSPKKYWDLYDPSSIQLSPVTKWPKGSPAIAYSQFADLLYYPGIPNQVPLPPGLAKKLIHGYRACVSYTDAQLGRVLAELDRQGLAENTIVVLLGDHGWKLSEYSAWSKCTNYEIDTHPPLLIRAPGTKSRGAQSDALVEFVDIYPTLAELCRLPIPTHCEGTSMAPLLAAPALPWKSAAFSQYPRGGLMGYTMRTDRWRYTEWVDKKSGKIKARELYDHQTEALDQVNLAKDPAYGKTLEELQAALQAGWRAARPPQKNDVPVDILKNGK